MERETKSESESNKSGTGKEDTGILLTIFGTVLLGTERLYSLVWNVCECECECVCINSMDEV